MRTACPSKHHLPCISRQPGIFPGGKGGRCVRLTTLPPSCAVVMKSGNLNFLEPSGPLQTYNGTALPFYLYVSLLQLPIRPTIRQILFTALWPETREKQTSYSHLLLLHRFDLDKNFSKKKRRNWKQKENSSFITDFTWIPFPIQIFFYKEFLVRQANSAVSDQLWLSTGCKHFAIPYKGKGREGC